MRKWLHPETAWGILFGGGAAAVATLLIWLLFTVWPAHGAPTPAAQTVTLPGYAVGEFHEPPVVILRAIDGRRVLSLRSLVPGLPPVEAPVEALKLVHPNAKQTNLGRRVGAIALKLGIQGIPNRRYFSHPRIACAAFVSYVMKKAGRSGGSPAVNTLYAQVRRRHGVLVASRVSTRYTPYYQYLRQGDLLFFHRGSRLGHVEINVGGGKTVGTSSSALRLGVRRIGNRGFAYMSVIRL